MWLDEDDDEDDEEENEDQEEDSGDDWDDPTWDDPNCNDDSLQKGEPYYIPTTYTSQFFPDKQQLLLISR